MLTMMYRLYHYSTLAIFDNLRRIKVKFYILLLACTHHLVTSILIKAWEVCVEVEYIHAFEKQLFAIFFNIILT